jgi:DNA repair exonuclease SbcCD nuclease subunit
VYRALFAADIHVGNKLPWAVKDPNTLITDRLIDVLGVLRQMSGYALEHQIRDIWIVGDLIDNRLVDAVTLKLVTEEVLAIRELELDNGDRLRLFLVPGNHEAGDAACKHFTLDAFASMGIWVGGVSDRVGDEQISYIEPVDGFEVVCMPYLPAPRAQSILEASNFHSPTLLLAHQTIKGGMVGGWKSPDGLEPALLESVASWVFSGHFHTAQEVTPRVHYLGAPVQHRFNDEGDCRGYWDVRWGSDGCTKLMVPVAGAPEFASLQWITSGQGSNELPSLDAILPESYINPQVVGSEAQVNKLWITAERWCADARARGARSARPVRAVTAVQNKARMKLGDGERLTFDTVLSKYLSVTDCMGLDRQKLEALGKELMADVDK